jgi:hypothetical protein
MSEPLPGGQIRVDVHVSGAEMLTAAMVRVAYDPLELALLRVEKGELLARGGGTVLLNTIRRDGVIELCMGRLNPESPGVTGAGCLASLVFQVTTPPESGFDYAYDLRDWRNDVLTRGSSELGRFGVVPAHTALYQNYPNPLSPHTSIVFALPTRQDVELAVYDLGGRLVKTLVNAPVEPGVHAIEWNGLTDKGTPAPSGVYFYKLRAGDMEHSRKLVVTR